MSSVEDNASIDIESANYFGENEDQMHISSENPLLDLYIKIVRGIDKLHLTSLFHRFPLSQDLIVLIFATRNCRGGKGQRALFHVMFREISRKYPSVGCGLLHLIPHFGYWKDVLNLLEDSTANSSFAQALITLIVDQLEKDFREYTLFVENPESDLTPPTISLCAKYAPRPNMHFAKYRPKSFESIVSKFSSRFIDSSKMNELEKFYRQCISKLNKYLDTPEIKMCGNTWAEIDFARVPSLRLKKHGKAFLNRNRPDNFENEDRNACRNHLLESNSRKRINEVQSSPHEIVNSLGVRTRQFVSNRIPTPEQFEMLYSQWDTMRDSLKVRFSKNLIAMCDVSKSMMSGAGSVIPMMVSVAMGILISELNSGSFANKTLTFNGHPQFVDFSDCKNLREKVFRICEDTENHTNTDLVRAYKLIIEHAIQNRLKSDEIPSLVVFSDMDFEESCMRHSNAFDLINDMFCKAGLTRPTLVYWNLNCNEEFPIFKEELNMILMRGYSTTLFNHLLFGNQIPTPEVIFRMMLDDSQYDCVRDALKPLRHLHRGLCIDV